jgi:hypothetical protein
MKFYIPEWDDTVDPGYDFKNEESSTAHNESSRNDHYMWEILEEEKIPFDGVLVSLMNIISNNSKFEDIKDAGGLRDYLRLPQDFPILGDCGAWGYIRDEVPAFKATEVFNHYIDLGVQEAVTVDHLVLPQIRRNGVMTPVDVQKRMDITYRNGVDGFTYWKDHYQEDFELLVAVQGLEPDDYIDMLKKYEEHGITTYALGGLAKKPTSTLKKIITQLESYLDDYQPDIERLHFFGLGRIKLFHYFSDLEEYGIEVSFDTASWLRQAWLKGSYFLLEMDKLQKYSAIRVPFTESSRSSFKGKRSLTDSAEMEVLGELEKNTMKMLRKYDEDPTKLNTALDNLLKYDESVLHELRKAYEVNYDERSEEKITRLERRYRDLEKEYLRTLKNRPWEKCDCTICRNHGIEVAIFRGNDRNRRRGFHNTYVMYNKVLKNPETWEKREGKKEKDYIQRVEELADLEGKVLVITGCTKTKTSYNEKVKVKAESLYTGRLFRAVRLYSRVKDFPYLIISAKYGLVRPYDEIGGYEQVLSNNEDVKRIRPQVTEDLEEILPDYDTVLVIAGKKYREVLEDVWDERFLYVKSGGYALLTQKVNDAINKVTVPSLKFYME